MSAMLIIARRNLVRAYMICYAAQEDERTVHQLRLRFAARTRFRRRDWWALSLIVFCFVIGPGIVDNLLGP